MAKTINLIAGIVLIALGTLMFIFFDFGTIVVRFILGAALVIAALIMIIISIIKKAVIFSSKYDILIAVISFITGILFLIGGLALTISFIAVGVIAILISLVLLISEIKKSRASDSKWFLKLLPPFIGVLCGVLMIVFAGGKNLSIMGGIIFVVVGFTRLFASFNPKY